MLIDNQHPRWSGVICGMRARKSGRINCGKLYWCMFRILLILIYECTIFNLWVGVSVECAMHISESGKMTAYIGEMVKWWHMLMNSFDNFSIDCMWIIFDLHTIWHVSRLVKRDNRLIGIWSEIGYKSMLHVTSALCSIHIIVFFTDMILGIILNCGGLSYCIKCKLFSGFVSVSTIDCTRACRGEMFGRSWKLVRIQSNWWTFLQSLHPWFPELQYLLWYVGNVWFSFGLLGVSASSRYSIISVCELWRVCLYMSRLVGFAWACFVSGNGNSAVVQQALNKDLCSCIIVLVQELTWFLWRRKSRSWMRFLSVGRVGGQKFLRQPSSHFAVDKLYTRKCYSRRLYLFSSYVRNCK